MARRLQRPTLVEDHLAVALSLIRLGYDTRAPRFLRGLDRSAWGGGDLVDWLIERVGVPEGDRLAQARAVRTLAAAALERARLARIGVIGWSHSDFPAWLHQIPDPPIALWHLGDLGALHRPAIAVIGSRDASPAGLAAARRFGRDLARAGFTVVSGLARGADGAAHEGALEGGGQTVAVLGCGLDGVYPPSHRHLAERITVSGVLVSEYPPGTPPLPRHFPLRNRIISGLSQAVVVVEASERSGTLITARAALEQGRDVLAVPGGIASGRHRGCHALIKDGARLVETVDDILEEVGWAQRPRAKANESDKSSSVSQLQTFMSGGSPRSVDELVAAAGQSVAQVLAELARLELAGIVARVPGGSFVWLDGPAMDR